jgi:hypothetical protein
MLKNLAQLFKKDTTIWTMEKRKFNVKKSFATFRLKNGENIISRVIEGCVYKTEYDYTMVTGRTQFENWIFQINQIHDQNYFFHVKEDRYVRVGDIMDIIGVVESDHEIEVEVPVKSVIK